MVLIDRDHLLPTLREQCKAERKERAFLLEGAYHSGAFFLESFMDLQSYVKSSTEVQLDLEPHFVLAALRSAQKANRLFVFLHTHPNQGNLHFSQLDRCFELNVIKLARQAGYLEPLIFLVASSRTPSEELTGMGERKPCASLMMNGASPKVGWRGSKF
ncbi:MAG: hypothetical protein V8T29_07065 [Oscillospiraceae bacterium]